MAEPTINWGESNLAGIIILCQSSKRLGIFDRLLATIRECHHFTRDIINCHAQCHGRRSLVATTQMLSSPTDVILQRPAPLSWIFGSDHVAKRLSIKPLPSHPSATKTPIWNHLLWRRVATLRPGVRDGVQAFTPKLQLDLRNTLMKADRGAGWRGLRPDMCRHS